MSNQDPKIEEGLTGVPASGEEFSLEEILAEYGGSLEQVLLRETEEATGEEAASPRLRQRNRRSLRQRPRLPLRPRKNRPRRSLPENRRFRRLPVPLLWKMWWGLR